MACVDIWLGFPVLLVSDSRGRLSAYCVISLFPTWLTSISSILVRRQRNLSHIIHGVCSERCGLGQRCIQRMDTLSLPGDNNHCLGSVELHRVGNRWQIKLDDLHRCHVAIRDNDNFRCAEGRSVSVVPNARNFRGCIIRAFRR